WNVASQVNVKSYELEWRTDFTTYKKVTEQSAIEGKAIYYAKHPSPLVGNNYYRIKAVDEDGKFDYSEEEVVKILNNQAVVMYPNPAGKEVTIKLGYTAKSARITLVNAIGVKVFENVIREAATYSFPVNLFAPGTYFVRITEQDKPTISLPLIVAH
ncbi:MAG: T9SS type A sorting domain-containing protein, partial [Pedobacter sp.]